MSNVPDCEIGFHTEIHEPSRIKYIGPSEKENNFLYNFSNLCTEQN